MPRRPWDIAECDATPEAVYMNRRKFLLALGAQALAAGGLAGCSGHSEKVLAPDASSIIAPEDFSAATEQAAHNANFSAIDRPLTDFSDAISFNNFIEFAFGKDVWRWVEPFAIDPWTIEVTGLVQRPKVYDIDELIRRMPLEERVYRHRCVEAWAMAVPWTGFALRALIAEVEPLASARYVKLQSFLRPEEAQVQRYDPAQPWPYTEGLSMAEAANELAFLVTGMYGGPLYKQNGAPLRLAVPWKYGFKSIKSITRIEFVSERPATYWNTAVPSAYDFDANVDPQVPHPGWSQKTERMLGTDEIYATQPYNGYGEYVADLYG